MTNYLETLNMEVTRTAGEYCELYNKGAKQKVLKDAKKIVKSAVENFNFELSKEVYREWGKAGNPVEQAVRHRFVPGAIKVQFKATKDDDVMGFSLKGDDKYPVSLPMMQIVLGAKVFADKDWFKFMEKFMSIMAGHIVDTIGDDLKYEIDKASEKFEFPEELDPLSLEGGAYALDVLMSKILFIPSVEDKAVNVIHTSRRTTKHGEVVSPEWESVKYALTTGDGLETIICNTSMFSFLILSAMHGILTHVKPKAGAEEHVGLGAYRERYNASELARKDTNPAPEAKEVPETHKPAKDKKTSKKAEAKKAEAK